MRQSPAVTFVSVFLCGLVLFFYRLGERDLWSSHEARAAQNAQSMLDTGEWIAPRLFDGTPETQKPPLYYWLVAIGGWLGGGSICPLTERLPAALAAIGAGMLLFLVFHARGRPLAGIIAALVLFTSVHFTWIGRTGRIDVPLTLAVSAAVLGLRSSGRYWQLAGYCAMAAGVMLKGPIGVVMPLAILMAGRWIIGTAEAASLRSMRWGIPLVVALAAPWFIAIHLRTGGEFTRSFFWYHHIQRATGGADTLATHPWWFYLFRWTVDCLPWSPCLIPAAWWAWRHNDADAKFGCIWALSVTLLLSLSRFKRADYLLPAYPGLAIAVGCAGERFCRMLSADWAVRGIASVSAAAIAAWVSVAHTLIPSMDAVRSKRQFAADVRAIAPAPTEILLFRVEDHLLAWRLGRPLNPLLEWENLDIWAGRPGIHFALMPAAAADRWRRHISSGRLVEVARYSDRSDRRSPRDLVLMRMQSEAELSVQSPR